MAKSRALAVRTRYVRVRSKGRVRSKIAIPLAIVAGFIPGAANLWAHRGEGLEGIGAAASRIYLGYASTNRFGYNDTLGFHPYLLKYGTLPLLAGFMVHWMAGKIGLNRAIARAGIPFVRI